MTSIPWRLSHLLVRVLGARIATHFGGPPSDYQSFAYPGTAAEALRQLDAAYALPIQGVKALDDGGLRAACGTAESPYSEYPMATLILHINREVIHHRAEIALLRDLYGQWAAPVRNETSP